MKIIGLHIHDEVRSAGLSGKFTIHDTGLVECHDEAGRIVRIRNGQPIERIVDIGVHPSVSEADIAAMASLLASHNPDGVAGKLIEIQRLRAQEYPPIGDQLDALWKGGLDAAAMKANVDAVKAKYPKP